MYIYSECWCRLRTKDKNAFFWFFSLQPLVNSNPLSSPMHHDNVAEWTIECIYALPRGVEFSLTLSLDPIRNCELQNARVAFCAVNNDAALVPYKAAPQSSVLLRIYQRLTSWIEYQVRFFPRRLYLLHFSFGK